MEEKISLLEGISRGLAELHNSGIIHGDIKPDNILLDSNASHPKIRFADFGLSKIREISNNIGESTMQQTKHARGTPVYCAPEMLLNPFASPPNNGEQIMYASASRKTDIYAFSILTWEVITQKKPFSELKSEVELAVAVHLNTRPSLDLLPTDVPPGLIRMIEDCWSTDRSKRKTATECYCIISHHKQIVSQQKFDIFFSHSWVSKPFLSNVYVELVKLGYRVWYDQNDMGRDIIESMNTGIENSSVVLACVNSIYQNRQNCMFELKESNSKKKPILTLIIESNPFSWANDEVKLLCGLSSTMFVDFSNLSELPWDDEEPPSIEMKNQLKAKLSDLLKELHNIECHPSFTL
jgi:serine/threonine protein kinase